LCYIDEVELRQAIERQLNKIEHAHRFPRAVSVGNPREFIQAEKQEEIAEGCKRLIKNCITCWNYLYLSQKLAETNDLESREALRQAVANGSVVSWQDINLLGEYDFSDEKLQGQSRQPQSLKLSAQSIWELCDQFGSNAGTLGAALGFSLSPVST
jgi:hypothetical protein